MRQVARPASVVIRTVGDDAVAWDRAHDDRFVLPALHARVLASIPSRWVSEDDVTGGDEAAAACLAELIEARLVVTRQDAE